MIPFKIEVSSSENGTKIARLSGRLNAASAPEAKDRLKALVRESSGSLLLDLGELSFIDSSGLAALVSAYKAAAESGGSLKLASLLPQVAQVFSLTRLDSVFETYADVNKALESY